MRVTLSCFILLCLSCAEGPSAGKLDAGTSHDAHDAHDARDAQDAQHAEDAAQPDLTEPAELDVEWHENLPLPDVDLTECEVTSTRRDRAGNSPHTFRISYDATTRTLTDPTFDTVFDENGHAVLLRFRSNPGAPNATLLSTTTYDEHGQPVSSKVEGETIQFENEYDAQGRLSAVVTKASSSSYRDEYVYEDELNPALWSRNERKIEGSGLLYTRERSVARERQTFTSQRGDQLDGRWIHTYRNQRLASLEQYGGGGFVTDLETPNGRATWQWDDAGSLLSFHAAGTWGSDLGSGDDYTETYSSGCQELVWRFRWLFHLPAPAPNDLRLGDGARSF